MNKPVTLLKKPNPMSKVNLDALIPREDFISTLDSTSKTPSPSPLLLAHLLSNENSNFASLYHLLRKPDFQRETNEWDQNRISSLIQTCMKGEFVPAIILWKNEISGKIFVIDGAHRLSALIAYINDDYGDGTISRDFYGHNNISDAEKTLAINTREYINKSLGSFKDVMAKGGPKADGFKSLVLQVQMIPGDVKRAEDSFFKINQQGIVLNPVEKELCLNRDKPSSISTRIIVKGAGGGQYWSNFSADNQMAIKELAIELNTMLFHPTYQEETRSIIKDHPLGGATTNATPMVYELIKILKESHRIYKKEESDKTNGASTLDYLTMARKLVWKMLSQIPGSLGLFPTIYFYSGTGKYIQSSFLGFAALLSEKMDDTDYLIKFTDARAKVEQFLIENKILLVQINRKYGSKSKSYRHMKGFFDNLINLVLEDKSASNFEILTKLKGKYDFINEKESEIEKFNKSKFMPEQKISLTILEDLKGATRCALCKGYVHPLSKDWDHRQDKKNGGASDSSNAQPAHVYCNNSKDRLIKEGIYIQ